MCALREVITQHGKLSQKGETKVPCLFAESTRVTMLGCSDPEFRLENRERTSPATGPAANAQPAERRFAQQHAPRSGLSANICTRDAAAFSRCHCTIISVAWDVLKYVSSLSIRRNPCPLPTSLFTEYLVLHLLSEL